MRTLVSLLIVVMACYASSCTKPGDVSLPKHAPRLVLHGYIAAGDSFKIALGKTLQTEVLAKEEDTYVNNGWMALYENNVFLDSLRYNAQEKRYVSALATAVAGRMYTIRAGAPGFPAVEATAISPLPVSTVALVRTKNARRTAGGLLLDDIKFSFNDPPSERNFYITSVNSAGLRSLSCVYTYDPAIEQHTVTLASFEQSSCIDNDALLYTDNTFNGLLKQINISADALALDSFQDASTGKIYRPYLKRHHVSEEYYRYFRSASNQGLLLEEGPSFLEPRMIKGNVKNGYGLFTVFSVVTDTIR